MRAPLVLLVILILASSPARAAPEPAGLPLLGNEGRMSDGYPRRYVDRIALRSLLHERRFAELTAALTAAQDAFETDPTLEYWPIDAAEAVGTSEPELLPLLDAWVAAAPKSFAPLLARGTHHRLRGLDVRGGGWAKDTGAAALKGMKREVVKAQDDLRRALKLKPASIAAMRQLILARILVAEDWTDVMGAALGACPDCFQIRVTVLHALTPRWGGSYTLMEEFITRYGQGDNPRLKMLPGFIDLDRADMATREGGPVPMALVNRALALGDNAGFYRRLASINMRTQPVAAAAALERAWELRPLDPEVAVMRVEAAVRLAQWENAGAAWVVAHQLDPSAPVLTKQQRGIALELSALAQAREREGAIESALKLYGLALAITPKDPELRRRSAALGVKAAGDARARP